MKKVYKNGKYWTKEDIKSLLSRNDKAVKKALFIIYNYQTDSEKSTEETLEHNGVGFNGADALILTSFVNQLKYRELSEKQMIILRKKMIKYSGQILNHMENH